MRYKIKIEPQALTDIQEVSIWYNERQPGLGKKFRSKVINQIEELNKDPHICAIRYKDIRCLPIKKFPYMIHYYINEETKVIEILAIISTDRNPKIWSEKTSKE